MPIHLISTDLDDSVRVKYASLSTPVVSANSFSELVSAYAELFKANIHLQPFAWPTWTKFFSAFVVRLAGESKMDFYFKLMSQDPAHKNRLQDAALAKLLLRAIKLLYMEVRQQDTFDAPKWQYAEAFDPKFMPTMSSMDTLFPISDHPSLKVLTFMRALLDSFNEHVRISNLLTASDDYYPHLVDLITGSATGQSGLWLPCYKSKLNYSDPYVIYYIWQKPPYIPRPEEPVPTKKR